MQVGRIAVDWEDDRRLRVHTVDSTAVDWHIEVGSTLVTRLMSLVG